MGALSCTRASKHSSSHGVPVLIGVARRDFQGSVIAGRHYGSADPDSRFPMDPMGFGRPMSKLKKVLIFCFLQKHSSLLQSSAKVIDDAVHVIVHLPKACLWNACVKRWSMRKRSCRPCLTSLDWVVRSCSRLSKSSNPSKFLVHLTAIATSTPATTMRKWRPTQPPTSANLR